MDEHMKAGLNSGFGNHSLNRIAASGDSSISPVIIIGAPRSGTNLLRNLISTLPGVVTWPCDEINAIWKEGNTHYKHDALPEEAATEYSIHFIRDRFKRALRRFRGTILVEKTCANSLRIEFIDRIFPEAQYVFIHRNGYDAVSSAEERWRSPVDFLYSIKKLREVPRQQIVGIFRRFLSNRINQFSSEKSVMSAWGPDYGGLASDAKSMKLHEVCAKQWKRCIEKSIEGLAKISDERVLIVSYEELVGQPGEVLYAISTFLDVPAGADSIRFLSTVSSKSIGKGEKKYVGVSREEVSNYVEPTERLLNSFLSGYSCD